MSKGFLLFKIVCSVIIKNSLKSFFLTRHSCLWWRVFKKCGKKRCGQWFLCRCFACSEENFHNQIVVEWENWNSVNVRLLFSQSEKKKIDFKNSSYSYSLEMTPITNKLGQVLRKSPHPLLCSIRGCNWIRFWQGIWLIMQDFFVRLFWFFKYRYQKIFSQ